MNTKFEFPKGIVKILEVLKSVGFDGYVVGGAIRDQLLGLRPKDWDIATNAIPTKVIDLFRSFGGFDVRFIDAQSYKLVTVNGVEVATYRQDIYKDGKTVDTIILEHLEDDLNRRDFTINAMAVGLDGKLIDLHNGVKDLQDRNVRFVGHGSKRIIEDPNRIIRAARMVATIDGRLVQSAKMAIANNLCQMQKIAVERVRIEIIKTMQNAKRGSKFFDTLVNVGALGFYFPSLFKTMDVEGGEQHRENVFEHSMLSGDYMGKAHPSKCYENTMLRLAAYLHDVGKCEPVFKDGDIHFYGHEETGADMVKEEMEELTFTINEVKYVHSLIRIHMNGSYKMSPKSARKLLVKMKKHDIHYTDWIALRECDRAANLAKGPFDATKLNKLHRKFLHELEPRGEGQFPRSFKEMAMSGVRVQELLGIGPSQVVGIILQYLFDRCVMDPSLNTPEQLDAMILGKQGKVKKEKPEKEVVYDCSEDCGGHDCSSFGTTACTME
jgi:tRNA nucleotidyltransferase (CCA-adding enzyme)